MAGFDPAIALGLGFDPTDLEFNQRGVLSPGQVDAVSAEHNKMAAQSRVVGLVMGVFYVGITSIGVVGAYSEGGAKMALMVAGVFAALGVIAVLANVAHNYRTRRHGPDLRLYVVEGVTRHSVERHEDGESHRIDIGGVTFFVFPSVFAALNEGRSYRIYYVEHPFAHWRRPVSAEVLL